MNGVSSKKEKRRVVQPSHTSRKSKQKSQKVTKDSKKNPPPDSPPRYTKYFITGQRILDPVAQQLTQGLSPSSSTLLEASPVSSIARKKASDNGYNRERTPVTVVGYTDGYPRGLHIIGGNSSPQPLTLAAPKDWNRFRSSSLPFTRGQDLFSPERLVTGSLANTQKPWTDLIEEGLNAGKAPSEVLSKLEDSPRTKLDKALAQNLSTLRNKTAAGPGTSVQQAERSSKTEDTTMKPRTPLTHPPVAPWRDISAFQSPNEQRRKAFNSFRLTSPDPPKTPMAVASRQGLNPSHVTTTLHARHREKQFYDPYSSSPAFSTTNGPDRDLAFMATSSVTAAILKPTSKRRKQTLAGKSVTGLSLSSRINEEMIRVKKTPSQTSTPPGRMVKRPNTQDMKNRDNYFPPPHSANNVSQQGQNNRFGNVLHTSPVAVPTTKRMEPTRNVLTPGYNAHSAATARVEARERYSNSMHPTTQKLTPMAARGNGLASPTATALLQQLPSSMPGPTNNILPSTTTAATKQLKPKTPLMPPVHVPGPKRENIYIGQYDGSDDSDSDTDTVTEKTQNNNSRPGTAKSLTPPGSK